jgi:hypothetical protein
MRVAFNKGWNYVSKTGQGQVNFCPFLQTIPSGSSLAHSLGALHFMEKYRIGTHHKNSITSFELQLTARSTRFSFPIRKDLCPSSCSILHSTVMQKIAWDLELAIFMFVAPTAPEGSNIHIYSHIIQIITLNKTNSVRLSYAIYTIFRQN